MKFTTIAFLTLFLVGTIFVASPVSADLIDFETGFTDLQVVDPVATATNTVTFSVGDSSTDGFNAYIAGVGNPRTAFVPDDTPVGTGAGDFFLTDEIDGPDDAYNYYLSFATPILDLNLDLYDYRRDGGPALGDTATLIAYSDDLFGTQVASDVFTIPDPNPIDGNVVNLSVSADLIRSIAVIFEAGDVGTGIDNINFTSAEPVPEPATLLLLGSGLVGLAGYGRRRFRKK